MATKLFCDKCWGLRVRNNALQGDEKAMPPVATHSVTTPTGSKADTCDAHLLETVKEALGNTRNDSDECTVKRIR